MVFLSLVAISVPITASTTELTATRIAVNPFDGRKNGSGDWVGAWIFLQNVRIDGKAVGKSSIGFEFSGNFPNKPIRSVGFASVRSFTDMPKSAAEKTHGSLGYRTWIGGKNTREESWKLYSSLNNTDKLIMKGICGLIADENFANDIIDQLEARKPFLFRVGRY